MSGKKRARIAYEEVPFLRFQPPYKYIIDFNKQFLLGNQLVNDYI